MALDTQGGSTESEWNSKTKRQGRGLLSVKRVQDHLPGPVPSTAESKTLGRLRAPGVTAAGSASFVHFLLAQECVTSVLQHYSLRVSHHLVLYLFLSLSPTLDYTSALTCLRTYAEHQVPVCTLRLTDHQACQCFI